jgi:hypothetical protein
MGHVTPFEVFVGERGLGSGTGEAKKRDVRVSGERASDPVKVVCP